MFAGVISDRVFQSRRGPVSAVLYGGMTLGRRRDRSSCSDTPLLGWTVVFMSLCVIGVHGMLSGTASMDFGGKKNAGVAVGIIDGFVYPGTALQSLLLGRILPIGRRGQGPRQLEQLADRDGAAVAWSVCCWPRGCGTPSPSREGGARPPSTLARPPPPPAPRTGTEG